MNIFTAIFDYARLAFHRRFYTTKSIQKYQLKQVKKMVSYATKNSVFYQEYYQGKEINNLADFYQLPTINKQLMMENFTTLNTVGLIKEEVMEYAVKKELDKDFYGYYQNEYVVGLSSGTSGNKGIYITPKKMTERLPAVFLARGGFPLAILPYRILFLLRVFSQGFEDINAPFIHLHYLSTMEDITTVINTINKDNINILMAPPSFIRELLPYRNQITAKLKRIMTYAEVLEQEDKQRFETVFQTKVIEIYQASEGQMASACKKGHLHINEDLVFVELYDEENNRITTPDIVGHKMVVTNLVNKAQPLIRYEMNDMVILDTKCECGSHFRRIKKVLGRHDDLLYFSTSENIKRYIFPDLFVRWIIVSSENIREFQVLQNTINEVVITFDLLDGTKENPCDAIEDKIKKELAAFDIKNPGISIKIGHITLPKEKNKYKRFISNIKL